MSAPSTGVTVTDEPATGITSSNATLRALATVKQAGTPVKWQVAVQWLAKKTVYLQSPILTQTGPTETYSLWLKVNTLPSCAKFRFEIKVRRGGAWLTGTPTESFSTLCPRQYIAFAYGQAYHGDNSSDAKSDISIDTRPAARYLLQALSSLGYQTDPELSGSTPYWLLQHSYEASVVAIFDHSNGGFQVTGGGGTQPCSSYGLIGRLSYWHACDGRDVSFGYLPAYSLQDVKLMIFAGCYTGINGSRKTDSNPLDGNLMTAATGQGVNTVIGFTSEILNPRLGVRDGANLSGNYFWKRFSSYIRDGQDVSVALLRAVADMKARFGSYEGYGSYVIGGAGKDPGSLTMGLPGHRDAAAVRTQAVKKDGVRRPGQLMVSQRGLEVVYLGPAKVGGRGAQMTVDGAEQLARSFVTETAPKVAAADLKPMSSRAQLTGAGAGVATFAFANVRDGISGPASASVKIDLRTGEVLQEIAVRVVPTSWKFLTTKQKAIAVARKVVARNAQLRSVTRKIWHYPEWTVTFDDGVVTIDAANGRVTSVLDAA